MFCFLAAITPEAGPHRPADAFEQNLKTAFIGDDDLTTKEFWSITGEAGEGALMSFNPDPRLKAEAADAVKQIRKAGFDPEGATLYTYAAMPSTGRGHQARQ